MKYPLKKNIQKNMSSCLCVFVAKNIFIKAIIFIFLLSSSGAVNAVAQEATAFGKSGPEAKAILDKAAKEYASYNSLKADFTMQTSNTENKVLNSNKGTIWLKGEKFKFSLGSQTVFCDGATLWSYNKDNNEVQITKYEPENGQITPSSLFTNFYDKNFLYRLQGSSTLNGKPVSLIQMTPLDKSKPYYQIVVRIDKKENRLTGMEIFAKGGFRYSYLINGYHPNVALKATDFTFNKADYPGVSVVDLRM